jgi:uncharacterized integral membrane protein
MAVVYVLMAVIGAAVAVFALQNLDPVVIRFVAWRIEGAPLALVVLLSLISGIVLMALIGLVQQWKLRSRIRQLERSLARAEAQATAVPPPAPPRGDAGRSDRPGAPVS